MLDMPLFCHSMTVGVVIVLLASFTAAIRSSWSLSFTSKLIVVTAGYPKNNFRVMESSASNNLLQIQTKKQKKKLRSVVDGRYETNLTSHTFASPF